jgi:acyl-CoA thioesterase-1
MVRMERRTLAISGAVIAILLIWLLWPSPYAKVADLNSRGTALIAFGDSITAGYGAAAGDDYPTKLSQMIGATVINAGVSGDTTESSLGRLDADVLSRDPRLVFVGLGGNDFLHGVPIATTETNLRSIVQQIHARGAMVILLGFRFPSMSANYESMYERIAHDERCLLVPHVLSGILTDPSLKSDEIHPNGRGYALIAERIAGPCKGLLKAADRRR